MEYELTERVGADRYERNKERKAYRNGHYHRSLLTKFGNIEDIQVPPLDKGSVEFSVID